MENLTQVPLRKTKLGNRTLFYDGESVFDSDKILQSVSQYHVRFVDVITPIIEEYNKNVSKNQEITVKNECKPLSYDWLIPKEYQTIDVLSYLVEKHDAIVVGMADSEISEREHRLSLELIEYQRRGLFDVLRTMIYIINTLMASSVVWGIGRGSSVASYVLYVLGVHDVDSYAYDLDFADFLHD